MPPPHDSTFVRTFLGWDRPVLPVVVKVLLDRLSPDSLWDWSRTLVLAPTREAGRRMREALAAEAAEQGRGLFPPHVALPHRLLEPAHGGVATPLQMQLAMTRALVDSAPDAFPALFPVGVARAAEERERFALAFRAATPLCELRNALFEQGIRFCDVNQRLGEGFEDAERWEDLTRLESLYVAQLEHAGVADPLEAARGAMQAPAVPEGVTSVVVAAVPDLPPIAESALRRVAESVPVEILVHAPEDLADSFDEAGRPIPSRWLEREIPVDDACVQLVSDPGEQADHVVRLLPAKGDVDKRVGPGAVVVGVPDERVIAPLRRALAASGWTSFDPGGSPLLRHPLCRLAARFASLAEEESYEHVASLLRHPDVADALRYRGGMDSSACSAMRKAADAVQNEHLTQTFSEFAAFAAADPEAANALNPATELLREALQAIAGGTSPSDGLRTAMKSLYESRILNSDSPRDREFVTVARALVQHVDAMAEARERNLLTASADELAVLHRFLETGRYYFPEPGDDVPDVELKGWLELHWNDARTLVLAGFNDQAVPESVVGHPFLPDSIRRRLGVTDNDRRFARDAYLFEAIMACRTPQRDNVRVVLGKRSTEGDVLRPSRLLFQCASDQLPQRARALFGTPPHGEKAPPWSRTWRLHPPSPEGKNPDHLRVTEFRDYLACPLRYYLKHRLRMESQDDRKRELDAADFGTVCHRALRAFAANRDLRTSTDADKIAAYLVHAARLEVERRFGSHPPVAVTVQVDSIVQRLRAAARVQSGLCREGWEIVAAEVPLDRNRAETFAPLPVSGTVDRIDRHADGRLRLLDYKTTDTAATPTEMHCGPVREHTPECAKVFDGKRERAWADLQLPLYALLADNPDALPLECGYFNLPKAVTQTGVAMWPELDEAMLESAKQCAAGVARRILDGVFWPPAERVRYDDFAKLFFEATAESISRP